MAIQSNHSYRFSWGESDNAKRSCWYDKQIQSFFAEIDLSIAGKLKNYPVIEKNFCSLSLEYQIGVCSVVVSDLHGVITKCSAVT